MFNYGLVECLLPEWQSLLFAASVGLQCFPWLGFGSKNPTKEFFIERLGVPHMEQAEPEPYIVGSEMIDYIDSTNMSNDCLKQIFKYWAILCAQNNWDILIFYTNTIPQRNRFIFGHLDLVWVKIKKVVQNVVFGPIYLVCNDYIKLVTLQNVFPVRLGCVSNSLVPNRNEWQLL